MDWLDLLAVQGTLKSLLQHHSSKALILWPSAFFIVQLSHLHMTTGKTIALTSWIFVGKVMSLLFNMLSRLFMTLLPKSKHLLIAWLQSPSAVIWGSRATQTEPAVFYRIQSKQSLLWPSPGCRCFRSICELHQPPASSHCYLPLLPACSDPRNQIPIKSSILDTTPFIIHGLCLPNSVEREMT